MPLGNSSSPTIPGFRALSNDSTAKLKENPFSYGDPGVNKALELGFISQEIADVYFKDGPEVAKKYLEAQSAIMSKEEIASQKLPTKQALPAGQVPTGQIATQSEGQAPSGQTNQLATAQGLYDKYKTYKSISGMFSGGGPFGGQSGSGGSGGSGLEAASGAGKAIPVAGGVLAGVAAGHSNYKSDPNMTNKKDGFGTKSPDLRAHVGGGVLGGVLGYFGGPAGAAVAGPAVKLAHPIMEPVTRNLIKFGDSWGGPGGALMMDPIGATVSGKYTAGQIGKGLLLGPFSKLWK